MIEKLEAVAAGLAELTCLDVQLICLVGCHQRNEGGGK